MTSPGAEAPAPPHVVMVVANDVTVDTRVKKMAVSLAGQGFRVSVVGLSTTGKRIESDLDGARIIRVPVTFALRDRKRGTGVRFLRPGYRSKAEMVVAKRRRKLAEREVAAAAGRTQETMARYLPAEQDDLASEIARRALRLSVLARRLPLRPRRKLVQLREALYRRDASRGMGRLGELRVALNRHLGAVHLGPSWRRILPFLEDYELAFGPVIDELEPDVLHSHDVHVIGIVERASARARLRGRVVPWIYDAHEYVPGLATYPARQLSAYVDLEREYIRRADHVITVSEPIAEELLRAFGLLIKPAVVMNVPVMADLGTREPPSIRRAAGLADDVPLLVYSGGIDRTRGVHTLVEAMPLLPDVHVALVSRSGYLSTLERLAEELGCRNRLHIAPFVANNEVAAYLSSATMGIHPLTHYANHEVALPNKYFEYLHGGLPVLVSDVKAMADLTRELGVGEVFEAENPASLAHAARKVLTDRQRYVRPLYEREEILERFSWRRQEEELLRVYRTLPGLVPSARSSATSAPSHAARPARPIARVATSRGARTVGIGPRNMAGQAWAWAKALERLHGDVRTEVFALARNSPLAFDSDVQIPGESWRSLDWQFTQMRHVLGTFTHLLLESGSGAFGTLNGGFFSGDLPALRARGINAALVFHGSEVRSPRLHRELEPWSPFAADVPDASLPRQQVVDNLLNAIEGYDGPRFVTTLDLLDYVPDAEWLPVVVDPETWTCPEPPLQRRRPLVVHAPSHTLLKGSAAVDAIAEELAGQGLVEYRRLRDVPVESMPAVLGEADIVLDQFALGDYGALACQAMAAGRLTIGHVSDRVRKRLPAHLPIVQATPDDLRDVLIRVVEDRDSFREVAAEGVSYVREYHDGRHSVRQLDGFLTNRERFS